MRQVLDCRHRIVRSRVHDFIRAELLRAIQALGIDVECNHARTHRFCELRAGQAYRTLAENRDRVVARQPHPPQRAVRRAGATGDRCTGGEADLVRQRHQRIGRHPQIPRVATVRVAAVDLHRHFLAELLPAGAALVALRAALVVMHHHALADPRFLLRHAGTDRGHYAARFVAGNHRIGVLWEAGRLARLAFRPTVLVQVAAAHAGRLHLDYDFLRAGCGVGELHHLQFTTTGEHDTTHDLLLILSGQSDDASTAVPPAWGTAAGTRCAHAAPSPAARQNAGMNGSTPPDFAHPPAP